MNIDQISELQEQAWKLQSEAKFDEAACACREALRLAQAEAQDSPDVANLLTDLAEIERDRQNFQEALSLCECALVTLNLIAEMLDREDAAQMQCRTLRSLGTIQCTLGDYPSAEANLKMALTTAVAAFGDNSPDTARAKNDLGVLYKHWGYFEKALSLYWQALEVMDGASAEVAILLHNIGGILHAQGKFAEAEEPARKAWEISHMLRGEADLQTLVDAVAYAAVLDGLMKYEQSETIYRHALELLGREYGSTHLEVAATLHNLAALLVAQYRYEEAEKAYRRALQIRQRLLGPDSSDAALTSHNLGSLLCRMGRSVEAVPLLEHSLVVLEQRLVPEHPSLPLVKNSLHEAVLALDEQPRF